MDLYSSENRAGHKHFQPHRPPKYRHHKRQRSCPFSSLLTIRISFMSLRVVFKLGVSYVEVYDVFCDGFHGQSSSLPSFTNSRIPPFTHSPSDYPIESLGPISGSNDMVTNIDVSGATMSNGRDGGKAVDIEAYPTKSLVSISYHTGSTHETAKVTNVTGDFVPLS
jgi:hypothetical protein